MKKIFLVIFLGVAVMWHYQNIFLVIFLGLVAVWYRLRNNPERSITSHEEIPVNKVSPEIKTYATIFGTILVMFSLGVWYRLRNNPKRSITSHEEIPVNKVSPEGETFGTTLKKVLLLSFIMRYFQGKK